MAFATFRSFEYDPDVTYARKSTLQSILQIVIFCAAAILAIVVVYHLINYPEIPFLWKIAISTFIIILPISFFLQAKFLEKSFLTTEISYLKSKLYSVYQSKKDEIDYEIQNIQNKHKISDFNHNSNFLEVFGVVVNKIESDYLREYYSLIFEKLISKKYYPKDSFFLLKNPETLSNDYYQLESSVEQIKTELQKFSSGVIDPKVVGERDELLAKKSKIEEEMKELEPSLEKMRDNKDQDRKKFMQFIFGNELKEIISDRMREEGIDFNAYILPLSFFTFIYFAGILVTLPLINSVFTGEWNNPYIPLFDEKKSVIPFDVIQWGFIGGLVYTSINLLNRFFRMDLHPKVYLSSSFRLIFAIVAAIIIDFLYIIANYDMGKVGVGQIATMPPYVLLSCFLIGIAPIQFLIRVAQSTALKLMEWTARKSAGNDSVTVIDGINLIVSERLGEGGIDSIQQLALSKPDTLSRDTKFDIMTICDWKDQALLYLYTGNIKLVNFDRSSIQPNSTPIQPNSTPSKSNSTPSKTRSVVLHTMLVERLGIRTFSGLTDRWKEVKKDTGLKDSFFNELGIKDESGKVKALVALFDNITSYGDEYINIMNDLRVEKHKNSFLWKTKK